MKETYWWPLWKLMSDEHGLTLLGDDCNQIAAAVDESRMRKEGIAFILVNALRYLPQDELVTLCEAIASRCNRRVVSSCETNV